MPRPAIPISSHRARGTFRKQRHSDKLSLPSVALGTYPKWFECSEDSDDEHQRLSESMISEWNRLGRLPHIKEAHRAVVEHACVLYARFVEDARGGTIMSASQRQTFHSIYMQLGGTPVSEAKVKAPVKAPVSKWAELKNQA